MDFDKKAEGWQMSPSSTLCNLWPESHRLCPERASATPTMICCSVIQSCPTFCNPMNCSMPGFPVLHHLPEFSQTHVFMFEQMMPPTSRWCHPTISSLLPPSLPALSLSQYQGLWLWMYQPASHISATQLGLLNVCFYDHGWLANEPGPELRFHLSYCWCVSVPDYAREELVFPSLSVQRSGVPLRRLTLILLESLANDPGCNRQWGKAHLLLTPSLRISL